MNKIDQILDAHQKRIRLAFVSSYTPRKCGIATFTKDLTKAINDLNPDDLVKIVALNSPSDSPSYPHEVKFLIDKYERDSYKEAAEYLDSGSIDLVCLQHEYGLFGGDEGDYIFNLLDYLNKPLVTTLHTILTHPTPKQKEILKLLSLRSKYLIAMLPDAKNKLKEIYGINPDKVVIIHHGVPDCPKSNKVKKSKFGWQQQKVLLMSGLISRNKGIEYVIQALPGIVKKYPNLLFVIAGQTHPEILRTENESYRDNLTKLARSLGVEKNLLMVNRYLSLDELLEYYDACDLYLTPHLDAQQVTSGTLAYALGMGKACISTPYIYAKDMLSEKRGVIIDFKDSQAINKAVLEVLDNPAYQQELERNAYALGRTMSWPRVAERYLILFRLILEKNVKLQPGPTC